MALALSGCSGGNTSGTTTPTPGPGGYTTGAPTPTPKAGSPPNMGSLFDMGDLGHYEWKITSTVGGVENVTYFRFEKKTGTTYNGTAANEDIMTVTAQGSTIMKFDVYYSPTDNRQLGGSVQMGDWQMPITADARYDSMFDSYNVADKFSTSDWPLTNKGPATLSINGKTYVCTKYWAGDAGEQGTVWISEGVPMPVKIESKNADGSSGVYELWDWG